MLVKYRLLCRCQPGALTGGNGVFSALIAIGCQNFAGAFYFHPFISRRWYIKGVLYGQCLELCGFDAKVGFFGGFL